MNLNRIGRAVMVGMTALFGSAALGAAGLTNPDASPEARAVLAYLQEESGKRVLTGQHGDWKEYEYIHEVTGKYAAVWGTDLIFDYRNDKRMNDCIAFWKRGVIPTVMWHWGAPSKGEGYENSKLTIDIDRCFEKGTPENVAMWADFERIADHLTKLRDANVPVVWRPMHECSGGWFWYDKGGPERFVKVWRLMHDYFTKERKLNNLIWVLGYDGSPSADFNPGSAYYDIGGADTYAKTNDAQLKMYQTAQKAIADPDKLITMHECGIPPDPEKCVSEGANWVWFMLWDQHAFRVDKEYLKKVYHSDKVVTLDKLPNWAERVAKEKAAAR